MQANDTVEIMSLTPGVFGPGIGMKGFLEQIQGGHAYFIEMKKNMDTKYGWVGGARGWIEMEHLKSNNEPWLISAKQNYFIQLNKNVKESKERVRKYEKALEKMYDVSQVTIGMIKRGITHRYVEEDIRSC